MNAFKKHVGASITRQCVVRCRIFEIQREIRPEEDYYLHLPDGDFNSYLSVNSVLVVQVNVVYL